MYVCILSLSPVNAVCMCVYVCVSELKPCPEGCFTNPSLLFYLTARVDTCRNPGSFGLSALSASAELRGGKTFGSHSDTD